MTLRDLGVFNPLGGSHPVGNSPCWKCGNACGPDTRYALHRVGTEVMIICATCHLKGQTIQTPSGKRVVYRVKEGDGSPYPVETTDGQQWGDLEVGPVG